MGILNMLTSDLGDLGDKFLDEYANDIEKKNFNKNCLPVITFDRCAKWAGEMRNEYPQSAGFVVAVKDNPDPQNDNDKICVIVALIDDKNKPISLDGEKGISTVIHGGTVDKKMLDNLNGNQAVRCKFK